jgi:hypothetical protein
MGQENGGGGTKWQVNGRIAPVWAALLGLLAAAGTYVLHNESRLSKLEQRLDDGAAVRAEMQRDIDRLEQRILDQAPK